MAIATITIPTSASAGGTTQAPVYVSDTAPAVPVSGTLWFNTTKARMYMYYVDPNTSQWIEV